MAVTTPPVEEKARLYRPSSPRPKSPHVTIYRWPVTMAMSIAHRATGAALYAGTVLLIIYLAALAMGAHSFHYVQAVYQSLIGQFILFLYTLALVHHMVGGIRHLFWDIRPGLMAKHHATRTAWATIAVSLIATVFIWFIACTFF